MLNKKIESNIPLTFNVGLTEQKTSIVTGKILNVGLTRNFTMVTVQFAYYDDLGVEIARSAWNIEGEAGINGLWAQIDPLMPPPTNYADDILLKYYVGFMLIATESWGTDYSDWNLVNDAV